MRIIRRAFAGGGFILGLLFLSPGPAHAQLPPPRAYLFVEVKDTAGKEVSDADVAVSVADRGPLFVVKTDKDGVAKRDHWWSYQPFYSLLVSKSGYLPSEHFLFLHPDGRHVYRSVEDFPLPAEKPQAPPYPPIKVVLRKTPLSAEARQAAAVEVQKRQLLLAVKKGHAASLRNLLAAGARPDTADARGVPAIVWAAFMGQAESIKELLAAGADVRGKNSMAHEALLIYLSAGITRDKSITHGPNAFEQREEVVRKLVEAGADANLQSPRWGTALNNAITQLSYSDQPPFSLSTGAVRFLIASGANVNGANGGGQTPLMTAAMMGSLEVTRILLEAGAAASVNAKDATGITALMVASQMNHVEIVRALLKAGAAVNAKDNRGQTPLMYAPRSRYVSTGLETIKVLLAAGANVNDANAEGQTALMLAAQNHYTEAVRVMLESGASVNAKDRHGKTALLYVESQYHDEASAGAVQTLMAAGANVHEADEDGQTPLMRAAKGVVTTVRVLLEAGARASINARDKEGRTALIIAVQEAGYPENVGALIQAGADVNAADNNGRTALMAAVTAAASTGRVDNVRLLLAAGAKVALADKLGWTALMFAKKAGDAQTVTLLEQAGAKR